MTTPFQNQANRANAKLSNGPCTAEGKARSSQNAIKHGLCAESVVIPGELAKEWQEHRSHVLQTLDIQGPLETELAERVALALWRLRRVAGFERSALASDMLWTCDGLRADSEALEKVSRYEGHLSRQMRQALLMLERLQRLRLGLSITLPQARGESVPIQAGP
jgi:hypothetical protein